MYVLFFLAWIVFNGNITLEIVIFGIVIATAMFAFMCKFMDYSVKKEINVYKKSIWFLAYVVLLIREIVKANLAIIPRILTVEEEMEPIIVKFKTSLKSDFTRMLLANSITLTPGTITVSLEEDEYTIHCLDTSLAEGLENSDFEKALMKLDEEE
ncbi:MAG: Na+/H+ antiporter subunit E [Agathobacter sp.]|nr:Na+/H+ antiporter subunit E [Agathobacter sp.]